MRIIFSTTTSRRIHLFQRTTESIGRHIADRSRIDEILHLDDGSSPQDLEQMRELFRTCMPKAAYRCIADFRFSSRAHHAQMMQTWHDLVSPADFVFHCEDDWEFTHGGNLIGNAIEVMQANPQIGQVGLWRKPLVNELRSHKGISFWEWPYDPTTSFVHRLIGEDEVDQSWPHFSLRPSILSCEALRRVGNFQKERFFEHAFARRWTEMGFTSAFLGDKYCHHLAPGKGESVYERERTIR